jgi:hypothetical protein
VRIARRIPHKGGAPESPLPSRYPHWFMLGAVAIAPGWHDLVERLFADLDATLTPAERERFQVAALRERDGRLALETYAPVPAAAALIKQAVRESTRICQNCGAPGKRRTFAGWAATLCAPCRQRLGAMRIGS